MKMQSSAVRKVAIVTNNMNCERNNQYYSTIEKYFRRNSWMIREDFYVDLVVICACGFHDVMYKKVISTIDYIRKNEFPCRDIILMGCLPGTHEPELARDFSGSIVKLHREEELDARIAAGIPFGDILPNNLFRPHGQFRVSRPEEFFHIKISEGCLRKCTFCVINKAKGALRSVLPADILEQFRSAVQRGYRRIFLMGEDTFAYGIDIGTDIITLVESLLEVEPRVQFDFGSVHIKWLKKYADGLESLAKRDVFSNLNLGLQHVNDELLKKMGRPVVFSEIYEVIRSLKKASPHLYLGADIIVGFPGETEEMNRELVRFFQRDRCIDNVSLSGFSDVKGAPSYRFEDKIPEAEITARWSYLTDHVLGDRSPFNRVDAGNTRNQSFRLNYENDFSFCKDTYDYSYHEKSNSSGLQETESECLEGDEGDFNF